MTRLVSAAGRHATPPQGLTAGHLWCFLTVGALTLLAAVLIAAGVAGRIKRPPGPR